MSSATCSTESASADLLFRRTYLVILLGAALWCFALVLAPLLAAAGREEGAGILYGFFHRICHQIGGRSFQLAGEPMAVCVRCSAIYAGFLLGTMIYPLARGLRPQEIPPRSLLVLAAAPMFLDVLAGLLGVHGVSAPTRLITGAIAGLVLPFFIIPLAAGAVGEMFPTRTHTTLPSTTEGLSDA